VTRRVGVVVLFVLAAVVLLSGPVLESRAGHGKGSRPQGESAEGKPAIASVEQTVRDAWTGLPSSANACSATFDYFPGGGMQIFACHLFSFVPYTRLRELSGRAVFLSGPHSSEALVLDSHREFGHYNPEFVRWAVEELIPGAEDEAFRKQTAAVYRSTMAEKAFLFAATYHKAQANPACWQQEVESYRSALQSGQLEPYYYERWFYFMNPDFCGNPDGGYEAFAEQGFDAGYDGNVVKTCVGFWARRTIDGTAELWHEGLTKLRRTYEGPNPYLEYD
jgi:hypothetical protein